MNTYPATVTSVQIRQGASAAIGTIIDGYLNDDLSKLLHETWKPEWPEKLGFSGGITAITCEAIMEIDEAAFIAGFPRKHRQSAARIREIAATNVGR